MPTTTVFTDFETRARRCARLMAKWLDSWFNAFVFATILSACFVCFCLRVYASPAAQLYRANVEAAESFRASVDSEWFFNRSLITAKLNAMATAYKATGEDDPAKLGELKRLAAWTSAAQSVADEQQYLNEVRSHGEVVKTEKLMFRKTAAVFLSVCMWVLSLLGTLLFFVSLAKFGGYEP